MLSSSTKLTVLSALVLISLASCAGNNSFNKYYKQNKKHSDLAFSFPKWAAMIAIPADSKKEVQYFTAGMKRVRVLIEGENGGVEMTSFLDYANDEKYSTYMVARQDGNDIAILAKEEGEFIREIILDINTEDAAVVVGILGKMPMETFFGALEKARSAEID